MPIPNNAKAIYSFLTNVGFTPNAAAGIVGNIEQESGGNPGEAGGGLIQILRGNPGYTSSGSLAAQLQGVMTYIRANGSIADINEHASSPSAAALYFSNKYERPNAAAANNANREASAVEVAKAAKSGNWPSSVANISGTTGAPALQGTGGLSIASGPGADIPGLSIGKDALGFITGTASTIGDVATALQGIGKDVNFFMHFMAVLGKPAFWLRLGAFIAGLVSAGVGVYFLGKSIGVSAPKPSVIPVPV